MPSSVGNDSYGENDFVDNDDGAVTDRATGLMWTQHDSAAGMTWQDALAWAEAKNAENYLGHDDWRLPDAKELQSIVDYTRSPDTTGSAAIDPVFDTTPIVNLLGQEDYGFYWTSTTHARQGDIGTAAAYICFGRGMGSMFGTVMDVHGAGCQRSDPKDGDEADYPQSGHGPQGDVRRVFNFVRLVRDADLLVLGDFNGDGALNGLDIPEFKTALADPDAWWADHPEMGHPDTIADLDGNGVFNGLDIPEFKEALGGSSVPEPVTVMMVVGGLAALRRRR